MNANQPPANKFDWDRRLSISAEHHQFAPTPDSCRHLCALVQWNNIKNELTWSRMLKCQVHCEFQSKIHLHIRSATLQK